MSPELKVDSEKFNVNYESTIKVAESCSEKVINIFSNLFSIIL